MFPPLEVHIVPNAIDTQHYCPGPADPTLLDRLADMTHRPCLRVGLVATYANWKGHDIFLKAAARVLRAQSDLPLRFYIVGGPIYQTHRSQFDRAELQCLASSLGISSDVGFVDFQLDIRPIYRALDVVVHASTRPEPFGLAIIEAMACGKPVIVSEAGGAAEIIRPGHDALGVPPGEVEALANAMLALLGSASWRATLGANGRRTVCERFDQERFASQMFDLFDRYGPNHAAVNFAPELANDRVREILHAEHL